MKDELTTAMHSEFTISPETERKENAFAVFQLIDLGFPIDKALGRMRMATDDITPYVTDWNVRAKKPLVIDITS